MTALHMGLSTLPGQRTAAESPSAPTYRPLVANLSSAPVLRRARYPFSRDFRQQGRLSHDRRITSEHRLRAFPAIGSLLGNTRRRNPVHLAPSPIEDTTLVTASHGFPVIDVGLDNSANRPIHRYFNFLLCGIDRLLSKCEDRLKMVVNVLAVNRMEASQGLCASGLSRGNIRHARRLNGGERGSATVELALVVPIMLLMVTGIYSFGTYLQQYLALTDAVNIGAKLLSINRGNTLDPCALVYTAVTNAAPSLVPGSMTFSYTLNGVSESGSSCSSSSSTTGAPSHLVQGTPITVSVSYPCSLAIYQTNLAPGCTMTAQLTEIEQ